MLFCPLADPLVCFHWCACMAIFLPTIDAREREVDMTSDMGTAAYMAPELASSKLLDDIDDSDLVMYVHCHRAL